MENKEQNTKRFGPSDWIVVVGFIIVFAVLVFIDSRNMGSKQSIVVIISAVAAAVVTYLLLRGQKHDLDAQRKQDKKDEEDRRKQEKKDEEDRRKNERDWQEERRKEDKEFEQRMSQEDAKRSKDARIYSNKIAAFSAFNEAVWQDNLDLQENDKATIIKIRKELFSKVILYMSSNEILQIKNVISGQNKQFPYILSSIVNILNRNAENTLAGIDENKSDDTYRTNCQALWNAFNDWLDTYVYPSEESKPDITDGPKQLKSGVQSWHFCMYGGEQLKSLMNGLKELSLIEYGESWRTGLVKQVKPGDLVFLFRGNKRYSGAFVAKGWRVFEYDKDRYVKEITSPGIEKAVVHGDKVLISEVEDELKKYDIYGSFWDQNSSYCANIVVDFISFPESGVINPNTTYRKTISRYYSGYAVNLLNEFIKADPESKDKINQFFE